MKEARIISLYDGGWRAADKELLAESYNLNQDGAEKVCALLALYENEEAPPIHHCLQDLTGQESGAIQYANGDTWIGNWSSTKGIPRQFINSWIGLGEELTGEKIDAPSNIVKAMQRWDKAAGGEVAKTGYKAWEVNGEIIAVIHPSWA